jgi:hypothetical protein
MGRTPGLDRPACLRSEPAQVRRHRPGPPSCTAGELAPSPPSPGARPDRHTAGVLPMEASPGGDCPTAPGTSQASTGVGHRLVRHCCRIRLYRVKHQPESDTAWCATVAGFASTGSRAPAEPAQRPVCGRRLRRRPAVNPEPAGQLVDRRPLPLAHLPDLLQQLHPGTSSP